jgi:Ca2+-binding EF-hand superfamily protein
MLFQDLKIVCGIARINLFLVTLFTFSAVASAQDFDLAAYLKRKDVNSNGKIEPSEMSQNTKSYLAKNGFNPEKAVSISKVLSKLSKEKSDKEKADRKMNRDRKVLGFGVEREESESGVAGFGVSSSETKRSTAKKVTYSESVNRQVNSTLGRYDRNKDGSLDKEEISRARWGSPTPQESDTNKDGRLSRSELSNRYASRESAYQRSSSSRGSSSRDSSKSSSTKKSSSSSWRPTSTRSSSSSSQSSSTSKKPASSSSSSDSREKYEKYAASLIGQYDENKDGKLSSEETKKMRRPPVGADQNKDGFITKSELYDSLSGANRPTAKSSSTADSRKSISSSSRSSRWGSSSDRSSSSRSSSSSSRDFEKFDKNEDRQVQMHEYSAKWDDKIVKEFYEKDKNGDGVITLKEWTSK